MASYDWALIKMEYVQGYQDLDGNTICPTLDDLCERHGCSKSTIKKKSASEKWQQERNLFGTKRNQRITEKKLDLLVEESVNIDNKALTIADKGLRIVEERLSKSDVSNHDVMKLSNTAATFHRMGKLALGEPTEHTQTTGQSNVQLEINNRLERLKRIEATENGSDNTPTDLPSGPTN